MRFCAVIGILLLFFATGVLAQGTWRPFVKNINGSAPNGAAFLNENYGFVSTALGTFRTTNGGKTWVHTNLQGSLARNQFYFYTPSNIFYNGELESVDSGMTWKTLLQPADGPLYVQNGIFFDASGRVSYNHARTWRYVDTNFINGESLVGNLDQGVAMWGGSGRASDSGLYTTDLGKTWHLGDYGVESDYGYAIPFTNTYFRCGGDGEDAIQRSIDGGASWQTVFGPISEEYLSDGFAGDGCVVYAQTMDTVKYDHPSGLIRSTDQGDSWVSIGGPIGRDDYNICGVSTRGAVCFAMSFHPNQPLWKYVDSGLVHSLLLDTKITGKTADTIFMSDCDSATMKMHVDFTACDFLRFRSFSVDSFLAKNYRVSFTPNHILRSGHSDSVTVKFLPMVAGTYPIGLHFSFSASDWSGVDTTIPLVLVITSNPAVLNVSKTDTINFGVQSFCDAGGKDTILLSNLSCHPLKVTSAHLEMDSMAKYDFSLSSQANYSLKEGVGAGKIVINFAPRSAGIKRGMLIIVTSIGNDTIPIYANVLPAPKLLAIRSDVMSAPICDSIDGFIHFKNESCREMAFLKLSLTSPYQVLPFRAPFYIEPGDSAAIPIRYVPSRRGNETVTAHAQLTFSMPFEDEPFDTTLQLTGFGSHGSSTFVLSKSAIAFDTIHMCESTSDGFTFSSTGCDSLPIKSIRQIGDPDFVVSSPGLGLSDFSLASGELIRFNIALHPLSPGSKSGAIVITLQDGSKFVIPLTAPVKRAVRLLSYTPNGLIDFGTALTCVPNDTLLSFTNPSCDTVRVFGLSWQGSGFGSPTTFPIAIPAGQTRTIEVVTMIDTAGGRTSNTAVLNFVTDADNTIPSITFSRSYISPHPVSLWLEADQSPLPAESVFKVHLRGNPSELADVKTIDYTLNYNSDLLGFLPDVSSAQSVDGKTFHINYSPIGPASSGSPLAEMDFEVYLTKDTTTALTLSGIVLNASDPSYTGCVAFPLVDGGAQFTYQDSCSDNAIRTFMRNEPLQFGITPNPAHDVIYVSRTSALNDPATVAITNAVGVKVYTSPVHKPSSESSFPIDIRLLPQGVYFLQFESQGRRTTRSFIKTN